MTLSWQWKQIGTLSSTLATVTVQVQSDKEMLCVWEKQAVYISANSRISAKATKKKEVKMKKERKKQKKKKQKRRTVFALNRIQWWMCVYIIVMLKSSDFRSETIN